MINKKTKNKKTINNGIITCGLIEITKAVPLGLIINEAITNSIKHAFIKSSAPQIIIKLKRFDNCIKICMADNGIGFNRNQKINEKSLGISLIESLANQIDATLEFKNENGTCLSIKINLKN